MDSPGESPRAVLLSRPDDLGRLLGGPVAAAARGLLGARLVREDRAGLRIGRIVEVEAYGGPEDRASHARFGRTRRTAAMFGQPGTAYVYGIYGMHTCLNVVTGPGGTPAAVLLRVLEPVSGLGLMRAARLARAIATRRADRAAPEAAARRIALLSDADLAAGPGSLAAAFDVDQADSGRDLLDPCGLLRLEPGPADEPPSIIVATPRIGVSRAGPEWADRPWRFVARLPGPGDGAR